VVEILDVDQMRAKVDVEGVHRAISIAMIGIDGEDGVRVGDWVLVHAGFAMARMEADEARETLDGLRRLNEMYAEQLSDDGALGDGLAPGRVG